jgi:hypothetical protein
VIELIRGALRGQRFVAAGEALAVERSLPAGHLGGLVDGAAARAGPAARPDPSRERAPFLAMIVQPRLGPGDVARLIHRRLADDPAPTQQLVTVSIEARKILVGKERLPPRLACRAADDVNAVDSGGPRRQAGSMTSSKD